MRNTLSRSIWMSSPEARISHGTISCVLPSLSCDPSLNISRKRIERAKELLAESELTVTEICFEVGFESLGSFSTLFHKIVGWSPSIYRARAWEMRRNPLKFIPNCYVIMHGIQVSGPKE
jgi:hypothetical protein